MKTLLFLASRNFSRQKRRNILIGSAIAFAVMAMTITFAFTAGLTDSLLNRIVIYMSGHIKVSVIEQGRVMSPIVHDKDRMLAIINENVTDIKEIQEAVGTYCRAIGNGKADYIYLVGVQPSPKFESQFHLVSGGFSAFKSAEIPPVLLSENKAKALHVKVGDRIRIRLVNVNGNQETAELVVVGIIKSQNIWMDTAVFSPLADTKKIMGYRPHETGALQIILNHPKTAKVQVEPLYKKLAPKKAYIDGYAQDQSVALMAQKGPIGVSGDMEVVISQALADRLYKSAGDIIEFSFQPKFEPSAVTLSLKIARIDTILPNTDSVIWMAKDPFFTQYNYHLPKNTRTLSEFIQYNHSKIVDEWALLPRTYTTESYMKKFKTMTQNPTNQPIADVATMYEIASQIVKMEYVLNGIAFAVIGILFFIISIGILNALRMTIKERTQEIGTMRAIGITQRQVLWLFLLEMLILGIVSWVVGILAALFIMKLLHLIQFSSDNSLSFLLVNRRLNFVLTAWHFGQNFVLLMIFIISVTFFPARHAAKLKPAQAFRHITE